MKPLKITLFTALALATNMIFGQGVSIKFSTSPSTVSVNNVASDITSVGAAAGTGGSDNSFFGQKAGNANANKFNCFFGSLSGTSNNSSDNVFFGYKTGTLNTGSQNSLFGSQAGLSLTTGGTNTYIGNVAGANCTTGYDNAFLGVTTGGLTTTGYQNTFIGTKTGSHNTTGALNTILGYQGDVGSGNLQYATAIGAWATVNTSNSIVLGRVSTIDNVGIGTASPAVRLHVDALSSNIRFDNLGTATPSSYLVLDASNNVKKSSGSVVVGALNGTSLDASNRVQLGQDACTTTGNPAALTSDRFVPLNNHNLLFPDGPATIPTGGPQGRVGIGVCTPGAKLDIYRPQVGDDIEPVALKITNHDVTNTPMSNASFGCDIYVDNVNQNNTGLRISSSNATNNVGLLSVASVTSTGNYTLGGYLVGGGGTSNIGVEAQASGPAGSTNLAGLFVGDVQVNGYLSATSSPWIVSDQKFKKNVTNISGALDKIKLLSPKEYFFDHESYKHINFPNEKQQGFIAQELEKVLPDLVRDSKFVTTDEGKNPSSISYKAVNYTGLIPYLVEAVQELDAKTTENKVLADKVAALQSQLNDICNGGCASLRGTISDVTTANVLLQNVPNPFSGQTTISYVLNTGTAAYMDINSLDGKLLKHLELTSKGKGAVTLNASELSAGTYTYSMYVDGQVVDTKIMVISASK
ncbi:MAG: tail fiber domain-containing protein [Bacteroidetes bacterium]|nr:tail fiber domain-containing protein [Bacteroidota bacterium]